MRILTLLLTMTLFIACGAFSAQAAMKQQPATQSGNGGGQQTQSEDSNEDAEDKDEESEDDSEMDTDDMLEDQMDEAQDGMFM